LITVVSKVDSAPRGDSEHWSGPSQNARTECVVEVATCDCAT
jgi:hypothetical protein